uniref:Uncharacterized protein n=1 Tax=Caenorhabditis japonica TaxID=281687 RepID=A0A8R1ESQ5_CAEJA
MTSTTKFVIENELEDGNGQDGGQYNEFIDDAILDEDMDIDNVGKDHEVKKREDEARLKTLEEYTIFDDNHVNDQVTAQTAAQPPVDATSANNTLLQTEVPSAVVKDIQDFMEANGITRIATSEENKLRRRLLDLQSQNTELRLISTSRSRKWQQ